MIFLDHDKYPQVYENFERWFYTEVYHTDNNIINLYDLPSKQRRDFRFWLMKNNFKVIGCNYAELKPRTLVDYIKFYFDSEEEKALFLLEWL